MAPTMESCSAQSAFDFAPEKGALNQYWYSDNTIAALADEVRALPPGHSAAMVSTPSIYFALQPEERSSHKVLDFDDQWKDDPGYVFYDFNAPESVPPELVHSFDLCVIDPPFITREVWEKYAQTARLLLKQGVDENGAPRGKLLCSTVRENQAMMLEVLDVQPQAFRPSIPNLVYQYDLYTNYRSPVLDQFNPEIDDGEAAHSGPQHQGLRVEHADDNMVLPTHSGGRAGEGCSKEELAARLDEALARDEHASAAPAPVLSPEVQALMARREAAGALKKALEALTTPVESLIKARVKLNKAEPEAREQVQASFDTALQRVEAALESTTQITDLEEQWRERVAEVGKAAKADMRTKKQLLEFSDRIKRHGQDLFKMQKTMLSEIKELKRQQPSNLQDEDGS